ncbi:MAG: hypothetical protein JKY54_07075 [Flavobacteriales bacterium]|nr:hypothetical protein [Flavobacteriales bacterium]
MFEVGPGTELEIPLTTKNQGYYTFLKTGKYPILRWHFHYYKDQLFKEELHVDMEELVKEGNCTVKVKVPQKPGKYCVRMSLMPENQFPSYNSKRIYIVAK